MTTPTPHRDPAPRVDAGPMLASRLIALLRTGRSYAIGNPVFTSQLEQILDVLAPVLREHGEASITMVADELQLNGAPFGSRMPNVRHAEQLMQEFRARDIVGLRFTAGLTLAEFEMFMRYFGSSDVHRGAELERACAAQGVSHAIPQLAVQPAHAAPVRADHDMPPAYASALETCNRTMRDARTLLGRGVPRGVEARHYKRLVHPLVDATIAGSALSVGLADLDEGTAGPWTHGVPACVLAVNIAHHLGLARETIVTLGATALLYVTNTGAQRAMQDPGARSLARRTALSRLTRRTSLDPVTLAAMSIPFEAGGEGEPAPLASQVVGIADAYVSLASHRQGGAPRWTPYEALGILLGPRAREFHAAIRRALVEALGVYPPGQIVELDDGSVARVCAANPADPERPIIERMTGPAGASTTVVVRGRIMMLPAARTITRAVPFARGASNAA